MVVFIVNMQKKFFWHQEWNEHTISHRNMPSHFIISMKRDVKQWILSFLRLCHNFFDFFYILQFCNPYLVGTLMIAFLVH